MSEEAILNLLVENHTYLSPSHIFISAFRIVGWWIVKGLIFLANCCQDFYEACFRFLDFTEYEPVKNFLSEFKVGVNVISSYLSKGLEFDGVIVSDGEEYLNESNKNLFYTVCTRALHELKVFTKKSLEEILPSNKTLYEIEER